MGLFKRLFGKAPAVDFTTAKIPEQVFLVNYRKHYAEILEKRASPNRLAELFLFRAWTAQFGYRIFSSNPQASEKLIGETVNSVHEFGLALFQGVHGYSVEVELGTDFISLIEDRWRAYDLAVMANGKPGSLPTLEIIGVLTKRLHIADPLVTFALARDFLAQLDLVKGTARELGILET